jgi:hypothetical protein
VSLPPSQQLGNWHVITIAGERVEHAGVFMKSLPQLLDVSLRLSVEAQWDDPANRVVITNYGFCATVGLYWLGREGVAAWRPPVDPGQEAQVDYGYMGLWTDPATGARRRVWAFSMVLSYSRHLFVRPVLVMDQAAWVESHVAAFAFFGGTPRRVILDNLRTGVIKADIYDPKINRAYAELANHYLLTELLHTNTQVGGRVWYPPFGGVALIDRRVDDRRARRFERSG